MGMVAQEVREGHVTLDRDLMELEAGYRAAGREAAALHVHGARSLLEKARRLAEASPLAKWEAN